MKQRWIVSFFILLAFTLSARRNTTVSLPDISQKAVTGQKIGLTFIKVIYHSPGVKGRKIWGTLVPYGKVWRAGANENTVINFSSDVSIKGNSLRAGKYGLHMIPGEKVWTVIFNADTTSWGSYFYRKDRDVLRIQVKPEKSAFREWLTYDFREKSRDSALLVLLWENLSIPIPIHVNTNRIVMENMKKELQSLPYWYWRGTYDAAKFCFDNDFDLPQALKWVEHSMDVEENFRNTRLKSLILKKLGRNTDAAHMEAYAFKIAGARDIANYAYSFYRTDRKKTENLLKKNLKRFNSWSAYRTMARFYTYSGDKIRALKYYRIAFKKAPPHQKENIKESMDKLSK